MRYIAPRPGAAFDVRDESQFRAGLERELERLWIAVPVELPESTYTLVADTGRFTVTGYPINEPAIRDMGARTGTVTPDFRGTSWVRVYLYDTVTLNFPVGIRAGQSYILEIILSTPVPTITWDAAYLFPGGVHPTSSVTIGDTDVVTMIARSDSALLCVAQGDFS